MIAHRVGEPLGTLVLALAVTVIEAALLLSLLFAGGPGMETLPRDTVYATVMIITTGVVGLCTMIGGLFGFPIPFIHSAGPIGIGFSLVVVVIAALNLVLDFDFIEQAAERGAPKYLEWYGAFALMVTLVWLYMEILRLLAKLRSRD